MKIHITTIFDKNYVGRALAFWRSLHTHAPEHHVHFLCLDTDTYEMCQKLHLENTTLLRPEDLNDRELLGARNNRTLPEFASTAKPALLLYMLNSGQVQNDDLTVFIDPDFFFFQSPNAVFKKMYDSGSITITSHRFPKHREHEQFLKGKYNAGIVAFKNDASARQCLEEWRAQCIEWCYLRYEDGKIGDQGYLSVWPEKYAGVYELPDKGVNLSTWNLENYSVTRDDTGDFLIDGEPLICYHFHGLKIYLDRNNLIQVPPIIVRHKGIYIPCIQALQEAYKQIHSIDPSWRFGTITAPSPLKIVAQRIKKVLF
jgi:hypothetical protein